MPIRLDGDNATATPGITGGDADTGLVFGTDQIEAVTGGTTRFTVENNGNVTIENGNLVLASGSGIDFSATADGSGTVTSELLDEYEEGTWTPTNGVGTGSFNTDTWGRYTKIGHRVWLSCYVLVDSIDNGGLQFLISGIPFIAVDPGTGGFIGNVMAENSLWGTSTKTQLVPYTADTVNGIRLYGAQNNSTWEGVANIDVDAADAFYISISYEVA